MNRILGTSSVMSVLAAAAIALVGCTEDLDTYQGGNGIYFDTNYLGAVTLSDTIKVSWGMKNSSETSQVINLPVKLIGNTADYDRAFDIKVETAIMPGGSEIPPVTEPDSDDESKASVIPTLDASAGVDFVMPSTTCVLPAGQAEVMIPVTVLRNETLHLAKRAFKVSLVENEQFKFLYSRNMPVYDKDGNVTYYPMDLQRVIVLDETFPIPYWWMVRGLPYFGVWSQKKAALICDVMNIDREKWLDDSALSEGYLKFCGRYMHNYLLENPHYEEDGSLMVMGEKSIY